MSDARPDTVVEAFSEDHVQRLTGISKQQLRYWDRTGFFKPSMADADRRHAYARVYSFRDVLCLQILNALRNEAKIPLSHLREVKQKLSHLGEDLWTKTTLYVLDKRVIFHKPETDLREDVISSQVILEIPLMVVTRKIEKEIEIMHKRDVHQFGAISRKRNIAHNRPVLGGTRIPVSAVKAFHEAGYSVEEIIQEYPALTQADIEAALGCDEAA
jgi:uncharacterized protein (DUF433 family)